MKKLLSLIILLAVAVGMKAQKIETSFWGCQFGLSSQQVYDNLTAAELSPIVAKDGIYVKDNKIYGIDFQTIGFKFTPGDAFYNIFGYTKYTSKQEGLDGFNEALDLLRQEYPNIQSMSRTAGTLKLYAYADGDKGTAFSLGLYKGNGGAYFVRLNVLSDYLLKREK